MFLYVYYLDIFLEWERKLTKKKEVKTKVHAWLNGHIDKKIP